MKTDGGYEKMKRAAEDGHAFSQNIKQNAEIYVVIIMMFMLLL